MLETKDFPPLLHHLPIGSNSEPLESVPALPFVARQSPDAVTCRGSVGQGQGRCLQPALDFNVPSTLPPAQGTAASLISLRSHNELNFGQNTGQKRTVLPTKYLGESNFLVENLLPCSVYHEEEQRNVDTKRAEKVTHTCLYTHTGTHSKFHFIRKLLSIKYISMQNF